MTMLRSASGAAPEVTEPAELQARQIAEAARAAGDLLWFDDHVVLGGIREKRLRDLAECEADHE